MWCKTAVVVLFAFGGILAGCGGDDESASVPAERKAAVAKRYADLVHAAYGTSVASAEQMRERIDGFLARPTEARLRQRPRGPGSTPATTTSSPSRYRFYGGPIDDPKTGPEGLINAWPMDEAYVDYVSGDAKAGIVNDRATYPKITEDVIVESNEKGGETNISSGWHAIEFLLWGQDRSKDGPGARPASDYSSAPNARRRAAYLRLTTDRLISDLRSVQAPWAPDGAFRATFLGDLDSAMRKIFRGIGALSSHELAGERMAVAFESKDQEDEHSCFSDNTNADVVNDLRGIRMVYNGAGPDDDEPNRASVAALVMEADSELGEKLARALDGSLAQAQAFPATFETMIAAPSGSPANKAIAESIEAIEAQSELLKQAAELLDVKVGFEG